MPKIIRVLLAEDNPGDVFLVEEALTRHAVPHRTTAVADGQQAWELIEQAEESGNCEFDFFILDLNVPKRSGIELAALIRGSHGPVSQTPMIIASSSNAPRDRIAAERAGADFYFCKPSNLEAFISLGEIVKLLWSNHLRRAGRGGDAE